MSSVIVAGSRTPLGKLLGGLTPFSAVDLGAQAIASAIAKSELEPGEIEQVHFGNVVQAGVGPNTARLAAVGGGVPLHAPATTINKLCLSGLAAIAAADSAIRDGQSQIALAGGTESMTNAPHLTHVRRGIKYGNSSLNDALNQDALVCGIEGLIMGAGTEKHQASLNISREAQDEFAALSHQRAVSASERGYFAEEIEPITITGRHGTSVIDSDEGIRAETTQESLAKLKPSFATDGTITAGSSSQLSDGAAALLIMDKSEAQARGITWLAEIISYGSVAGPDPSLLLQPAHAIKKAASRTDLSIEQIDLFEINEAFASVAIASMRQLSIDADRVNVNGGAIALGHPVGMSGARLVLTLALELRRRGGGVGAAALCGGGGQGDAMIIRVD